MAGQWSERIAQIGPKLKPFKRPALILWGLVTLLWLIFEIVSPRYERTLEPQRIEAYAGARYEMPLLHGLDWRRLFYLAEDDIASPNASQLGLFEDGRELGPAHALHSEVESVGHGRFSHWRNRIVFSTSDNSDPRTNGRTYTVRGQMHPFALMRIIGWLGLGFGALLLVRRYWPGYRRHIDVLNKLFDPKLTIGRPLWMEGAAAAAFVVVSVLVYLAMLNGGYTTNLALAGYFPTSDGSDYWACANQLLDYGSGNFWCHRRPIYSMVLGGVALLSGRNLEVVLYAQSALLGGCLFLYAREVARWLGLLPAVFAAIGLLIYGWTQAIGMTMSEFLGLSLGMLSAALLLRAAARKSVPVALLGIFALGIAESVRPAGVFALPALLVWLATMKDTTWPARLKTAGLGLAALVAALAAHSAFVALAGGNPINSQGNAAALIYGVTAGGDWTLLAQQHPELAGETASNTGEILRLSLANFFAHPGTLVSTMITNIGSHARDTWLRIAFQDAPTIILYLLGLAALLFTFRRSSRSAVVLAVVLGELISALFLESQGSLRIWAATGPITQYLPWLLAAALVGRRLLKLPDPEEQTAAEAAPTGRGWLTFAGPPGFAVAGFLVLALLPPVHALTLPRTPPALVQPGLCGAEEDAVRTSLDGAAILTVSAQQRAPASFPRRIGPKTLLDNMRATWFRENLRGLQDGRLVRVVPDGPRPQLMPGYFVPLDVALPARGMVTLCVDRVERIEIASFPFYRVISAHPA